MLFGLLYALYWFVICVLYSMFYCFVISIYFTWVGLSRLIHVFEMGFHTHYVAQYRSWLQVSTCFSYPLCTIIDVYGRYDVIMRVYMCTYRE